METEWVNFKYVKEAVDMQMVLARYGVSGLTKSGNELRGPCPIHKGSDGSKNFTVNVRKNAFRCFSQKCSARGNVLDLVAAMEHCDIRNAALKLRDWFKVGESGPQSPTQDENDEQRIEIQRGIYRDQDGALYELLTQASSAEDFEPVVVFRELFGDYQFWVAPVENFSPKNSRFTLVKPL